MQFRTVGSADTEILRALDAAAYGRVFEADLAVRLRAEGVVLVELMAEVAGTAAGHALFARAALDAGTRREAALLAIVGVPPEFGGHGIGATLIRAGLAACGAAGCEAAAVLGPPAYFSRFGFSAEAARQLDSPFSGRSFMALELVAGALSTPASLRYPAAFGLS